MKVESYDMVSNKRFKRPPPRINVSCAAAQVDNRPTTPTSTASSESSFYPSPRPDNAKSSVFRRSTPVLSGSGSPRNDDDNNKAPNRCGFHPVVSEPSSPIRPRPQLSWDESLRSIDEHVFDVEPGFDDFEASLKEGLDECMKGTEVRHMHTEAVAFQNSLSDRSLCRMTNCRTLRRTWRRSMKWSRI